MGEGLGQLAHWVSVRPSSRVWECTYRQDQAHDDHAKVDALLGGAACLLAQGELGPGDLAVVVEGGDGAAAG